MAKADVKQATDVIGNLFDNAHRLQEEKHDLLKDIDSNRKALRTLWEAGALSDEQATELSELYPPRTRKDAEDGQESAENGSDDAPQE